jgi:hypothetical protein
MKKKNMANVPISQGKSSNFVPSNSNKNRNDDVNDKNNHSSIPSEFVPSVPFVPFVPSVSSDTIFSTARFTPPPSKFELTLN